MEPGDVEALVACLVANPHDTDALARAHRQGETDPQGYAALLETVGSRTTDPSYASHWLSEAANIWSFTLGDAHRAARVLMMAVDRDPTQPLAADRLAQLYREKGDLKALAAMLDRRVRLLTPMLTQSPDPALRTLVATLHEELGKLWSEPPLEQPKKAVDHFRRALDLDPTSAYAVFSIRQLHKSQQQWDESSALYPTELALERDPARRLLLARDEAESRRSAGDLAGVTAVLRGALDEIRQGGGDDPTLAQEVAGSLLDRAEGGAPLDDRDRVYGADLLAQLAEAWGGEHGLAYAAGALDLSHGHDRAMQLFAYYANGNPDQADALTLRYHAYVAQNPDGPVAREGRLHLAAGYEALGQLTQALQVLGPLQGQSHEVDDRIAVLSSHAPPPAVHTPVIGVEQMNTLARSGETEPTDEEPEPIDTEEAEVPPSPERTKEAALTAARACVAKADKAGALERYLEALGVDPTEPEALSWVEDALRAKRDYAKLRDVLWASARAMGHDSVESRKLRLREIAGLSESNLKDLDGAIQAWRQLLSLDRGDEPSRQSLVRALEKRERWDDLATLYEQEASASADLDAKLQLEKKLAALHETKRSDLVAAAEAWVRIAGLTPEDDSAVTTAVDLYVKAGKGDVAAAVIEELAPGIPDASSRATLLDRLGALLARDGAGDLAASGRAYQRAAEASPTTERWAQAEKALADGQSWPAAATAAEKLAELSSPESPERAAEALSRAAKYMREAGCDGKASTALLERAYALAPATESFAEALLASYRQDGEVDKLARLLGERGRSHGDGSVRAASLREAAKLYEAASPPDEDAAKLAWQGVLDGGEDAEALERLASIAESRGELGEAATLLGRMGALASDKAEKTVVALRQAALLGRVPDRVSDALARYEAILDELDPSCRDALRAIADLELARGAPKAAANALERELAIASAPLVRREVAQRLADAYDAAGDDAGAFTALSALREADPDDFDVLGKLAKLAGKLERWGTLADLLEALIEVEADDTEISTLTQRRAALLADKLGRGDEALAALQELADAGDDLVREAYVELGDRLGWRGVVASKLVDWWFAEQPSMARAEALAGAFERFALVGRDADAVKVGVELLRASRDAKLAAKVEELAVKAADDNGLGAAQEILGQELTGAARAAELVRQAEMRVQAKMPWAESTQHGETALGGLSPEEVAPLLARLAALAPTPAGVIDLYERQVSRSRGGEAREKALMRAAEVAGVQGDLKRARTFFDLLLSGNVTDMTLDAIARGSGDAPPSAALHKTLAEALAEGGGGLRDGGRSRANFLRRAAKIAQTELGQVDQAFAWLSDALVAHADAATLDSLESLAEEVGAPQRVDAVLSHVLTEVFDGPLVRLVLARRAKLRKDKTGDKKGAAADLKKLHDLSPTDEAVMNELSALLTELGDHRSMVQLYEDQILRSKDQAVRAELGRKVAQIWDGELADSREAADAWRRVLRLKPGDEEATQGLERAKSSMLKKPAGTAPAAALTPKPTPKPAPVEVAPPAVVSDVTPSPPESELSPATTEETESLPERDSSVEDVNEDDLEPEPTITGDSPHLERMLGSTDPFGEADTTHTSIDVRLPLAAARAIEERAMAAAQASANGSASSRLGSKPPPLPPADGADSLPTSTARSPEPVASGRRGMAAEQALAMTDQNAPVDFSATEAEGSRTLGEAERGHDIPPDILSATELALDDEDDDVLVVDEFVEDSDEYEDVVEPSKPPGPVPG